MEMIWSVEGIYMYIYKKNIIIIIIIIFLLVSFFLNRIGGNKGIFIIIRAMEGHLEDENVILHSCTTLTNIFHNNIDNRLR